MGMEAAFFGSEPEFLPDAFFDANPALLGPRVDHPRRSNDKAFAPCVSVPQTREMYSNMMAELLKNAPEIKTFYFKTNDAGSGICWSQWLYSGPNGPDHCRKETTGQRVEYLLNAFKSGADKARQSLDIYLSEPQGSSNFSEEERNDIQNHLPANCYFRSTPAREIIQTGSDIPAVYPVNGIPDPVSFLRSLKAIGQNKNQVILINFRSFYDRGNESAGAEDLEIGLLADHLQRLSSTDQDPSLPLRALCETYAGKKDAQNLYQAFNDLNAAFRFRSAHLGNLYGINWDVAARMINRPLVAVPQRLSKEEEAYFLPFIFNVSEQEARMDYSDIQGGDWTTSPDTIHIYTEKIKEVADRLNGIGQSAPQYAFIKKMATGLRIHASLLESVAHFAAVQSLRNANAEKLNGPAHRPDKLSNYSGDEDLQKFSSLMREELDNTQNLIGLLQSGGIHSLCLAKDSRHEDCFLLGPNIIEQLKRKRKIMLNHWTDIEDYLTSPFK
jgi:hypothetical protein